jgi:hypothetical protein
MIVNENKRFRGWNMGFKSKISIVTTFLFLVLGFQNCTPDSSRVAFKGEGAKATNSFDSGTPYEGKIYITMGNLCADGSEIHSKITLSTATQGQLNRENCQDIAPIRLTADDFQLNSDSLNYKNQTFTYLGIGLLGITNLSVSNDVNNFYYGYTFEGQPSWLQIYLDTDNNPATGYSHNGIGADFMIENDNVWKYSAPNGSSQSTWAWTSLVSANKNIVSQSISWSFARSAIGSPAIIKLVAHTSLGAQTDVVTQIPK